MALDAVPSFKVVLVGDAKVGKTSILAQWARNEFLNYYEPTVSAELSVKEVVVQGRKVRLQVWDIGFGEEETVAQFPSFARGAAGVLLMYDRSDPNSVDGVDHWLEQVRSLTAPGTVFVVLSCKSDLPIAPGVAQKAKNLCDSCGMPHVETSAQENFNISLAFETLAGELLRQALGETPVKPVTGPPPPSLTPGTAPAAPTHAALAAAVAPVAPAAPPKAQSGGAGRAAKLVILGEPRVGKSCLGQRLGGGDEFETEYMPTARLEMLTQLKMVNGTPVRLQVWDVPGDDYMETRGPAVLRGLVAALVLYDITERSTFERIDRWFRLLEHQAPPGVVVMLVGHKSDQSAARVVGISEGRALATSFGMPFAEVSSRTGVGLDRILDTLLADDRAAPDWSGRPPPPSAAADPAFDSLSQTAPPTIPAFATETASAQGAAPEPHWTEIEPARQAAPQKAPETKSRDAGDERAALMAAMKEKSRDVGDERVAMMAAMKEPPGKNRAGPPALRSPGPLGGGRIRPVLDIPGDRGDGRKPIPRPERNGVPLVGSAGSRAPASHRDERMSSAHVTPQGSPKHREVEPKMQSSPMMTKPVPAWPGADMGARRPQQQTPTSSFQEARTPQRELHRDVDSESGISERHSGSAQVAARIGADRTLSTPKCDDNPAHSGSTPFKEAPSLSQSRSGSSPSQMSFANHVSALVKPSPYGDVMGGPEPEAITSRSVATSSGSGGDAQNARQPISGAVQRQTSPQPQHWLTLNASQGNPMKSTAGSAQVPAGSTQAAIARNQGRPVSPHYSPKARDVEPRMDPLDAVADSLGRSVPRTNAYAGYSLNNTFPSRQASASVAGKLGPPSRPVPTPVPLASQSQGVRRSGMSPSSRVPPAMAGTRLGSSTHSGVGSMQTSSPQPTRLIPRGQPFAQPSSPVGSFGSNAFDRPNPTGSAAFPRRSS